MRRACLPAEIDGARIGRQWSASCTRPTLNRSTLEHAGLTPFTHGETIAVDTQSVERHYRLTFFDGAYSLFTDGAAPMTGALRHYGAVHSSPVYSLPSFIFFGDNTTSAAGRSELSMMALAPVPEPGAWALLLAGFGTVALAVRREQSPCANDAGAR